VDSATKTVTDILQIFYTAVGFLQTDDGRTNERRDMATLRGATQLLRKAPEN